MRPIVIMLLVAGWQTPAQAFFCFSFGSHGGHDTRFATRAWRPPPPVPRRFAPYPAPLPIQTGDSLPPIRETKKSPDIIQGYRFRPLSENAAKPAVTSPRDWRD